MRGFRRTVETDDTSITQRRLPGLALVGMPPVIVCPRCGAVHSHQEASEPGLKVLARLARVGLGAGAPPVLSIRHRGR